MLFLCTELDARVYSSLCKSDLHLFLISCQCSVCCVECSVPTQVIGWCTHLVCYSLLESNVIFDLQIDGILSSSQPLYTITTLNNKSVSCSTAQCLTLCLHILYETVFRKANDVIFFFCCKVVLTLVKIHRTLIVSQCLNKCYFEVQFRRCFKRNQFDNSSIQPFLNGIPLTYSPLLSFRCMERR